MSGCNCSGKALFSFLLLIISFTIALLCAELALRVIGYKPWAPKAIVGDGFREELPLMTDKDPVLGWVNRPGTYNYSGFSPEVENIKVTVLPDGGRLTSEHSGGNSELAELVFLGGSYTQGYAISDEETFAWQIQERLPLYQIKNQGVPGYGTYQSYLLMKKIQPQLSGQETVFYGYIGHHILRNILDPVWVDMFSRSDGPGPLPPYVTLNAQGELQEYPVGMRRTWPLRQYSALVNRLELAWLKLSGGHRVDNGLDATKSILYKMNDLAETTGARFVVLVLQSNDPFSADFESFLSSSSLESVYCSPVQYPDRLPDHLRVVGEGHPNAQLNAFWADCVTDYMNNPGEVNER